MRLQHAVHSETGWVRPRNEDRCLADEALGVFGVADGVGGMPGGLEAAEAAVACVLDRLRTAGNDRPPDLAGVVTAAALAVEQRGRAINPREGIATTLTFGIFHGRELALAHIGDSRCYLWRTGRLTRLTRDHLEGYALSRCLGHPVSREPDIAHFALEAGDRVLFCTDGLTRSVADVEVAAALGRRLAPAETLRGLVGLSLRRGGLDNVSAVLVDVEAAAAAH